MYGSRELRLKNQVSIRKDRKDKEELEGAEPASNWIKCPATPSEGGPPQAVPRTKEKRREALMSKELPLTQMTTAAG